MLDDSAITYKLLLYFFFKGANSTNAFSQFDKSGDLRYEKLMTEENFFDMFNRIHNPEYYYGRQKTQKKKTEKKKKTRRTDTVKRYPVFKVQN